MKTPTKNLRLAPRQKPDKNPVMYQTWEDLLFIHWEADYYEIEKTLPSGLYVDTFNHKTYVGITPFFLKDLRLPLHPSIPGISNFLETNVRTYVHDEEGIPGIFFYSLHANQKLAVEAANMIPLPYKLSEINAEKTGIRFFYKVKRKGNSTLIESEFVYQPDVEIFYPDSESLEYFLVERYILFYIDKSGNLKKIRVSHLPYPLQNVKVDKYDLNLLTLENITPIAKTLIHQIFSPGPGVTKIYLPE